MKEGVRTALIFLLLLACFLGVARLDGPEQYQRPPHSTVIQEDDPDWNCSVDGNAHCGPLDTTTKVR